MAIRTYRYRQDAAVDDGTLKAKVHPTATALDTAVKIFLDIVCEETVVDDLHEFMARLGYTNTATDPASTIEEDANAEIAHQELSGAGSTTHTQLDSHVASTSNPHSVTQAQVGLGNVTNDAQLKRSAGDFVTFVIKGSPIGSDVLLIEDSAAGNAKKHILLSTLIGGAGSVPNTRVLTAGAGLTGGGDLTVDRTFDVVANADGSITVNANDIQVGVLATDAQHGARGGATQHAIVTTVVNGFMSAIDKVKLDAIESGATIDDKDVKVTANDTTPAFLLAKLAAGSGIILTEVNDGGNESIQIATSGGGGGTDENVKVSVNDTTTGHLVTKLVSGAGITLTELNDGADEDLQITATNDSKAKVSANDTTPDYLLSKFVAGSGITLTELNDGGNEDIQIAATDEKAKVSANDTTPSFLGAKIVAGANITVTELNDGSNETLSIAASAGGGGLAQKAGVALAAGFLGTPRTIAIVFAGAFADANYSITLTAEVDNASKSFVPVYLSKANTGFTISIGSGSVANLVGVSWIAMKHGES